jgi:hypothetical protein
MRPDIASCGEIAPAVPKIRAGTEQGPDQLGSPEKGAMEHGEDDTNADSISSGDFSKYFDIPLGFVPFAET